MHIKAPCVLPYFTVGWPDPQAFVQAVVAAAKAGCPAFEAGIPFSDPVADGPVIQKTSAAALEAGINWPAAMELIALAVKQSGLPAIAMTYCNPLYAVGLKTACQQLALAGCQGLIVPDMTLEEGSVLEATAHGEGLDLIYLVAPTTPDERVLQLVERCRGFIYLVSLRGVTGARQQLPADLLQQIERVGGRTSLPVMVGFGISTAQQARQVAAQGAGVIVGSALLQAIEAEGVDKTYKTVERFLSEMVASLI